MLCAVLVDGNELVVRALRRCEVLPSPTTDAPVSVPPFPACSSLSMLLGLALIDRPRTTTNVRLHVHPGQPPYLPSYPARRLGKMKTGAPARRKASPPSVSSVSVSVPAFVFF